MDDVRMEMTQKKFAQKQFNFENGIEWSRKSI